MSDGYLSLRTHEDAVQAAERAFQDFWKTWSEQLPGSAEIIHVGGTSVRGCLTKGDLDVCIRSPASDFVEADRQLAQCFQRNEGSYRGPDFSSFKDDAAAPPLGVQLVAKGSALDVFVAFRDRLRQNSGFLCEYNALKLRYVGQPMEPYREAKSAFINHILTSRP